MKTAVKTRRIVLCALFTALIAVGAFLKIPMPYMDYFTLQSLFVVLAGLLLGPGRGALSAAVYVAVGLCGIPVFAAGGGVQYIFRPTFGYLLGFIAAAAVTGFLSRKARKFGGYFSASLIGMSAAYIIGFAYKYLILNHYLNQKTPMALIFASSLTLDIPGDIALCAAASVLAGRLRGALKKENLL